jgi:hypothetical protein
MFHACVQIFDVTENLKILASKRCLNTSDLQSEEKPQPQLQRLLSCSRTLYSDLKQKWIDIEIPVILD